MADPLVLGISRTHDVSAALIQGNELLVLAEAERVLDEKHAQGADKVPPAVSAALKQIGATASDIDVVALADTGRENIEAQRPDLLPAMHAWGVAHWGDVCDEHHLPLGPLGVNGLRPEVRIMTACHHASHAAASVFLSGYAQSLNCVIDGYGVCCGTVIYDYRDGRLSRIEQTVDRYLLGWRYQLFGLFVQEIDKATTDVLDLAGKVMGLNAYGTVHETWVRGFEAFFEGSDFRDYERAWDATSAYRFAELVGEPGLALNSHSAHDTVLQDATASMQEAFSRIIERIVLAGVARSGHRAVTLSGGCALNVLANARVAALPQVDHLYVQPTAGDGGLSIGAAALAYSQATGRALHAPGASSAGRADPYKGLALEIDVPLPGSLAPPAAPETVSEIARRLVAGEIVGLVAGRAEIGPRALGHRSVLAYPRDAGVRDRLNRLKAREWWRPFAPVCRLADAQTFFEAPAFSPYMLLTARVRPEYRAQLQAAAHEDGTARLQVLPDRDAHPLLWDVLSEIAAITGVGVLINTSFNISGKPLLNKASTALQVLRERELDAVWIEGKLIAKIRKS